MDDKRSQDQELWDMIDAARPASDDMALPEFARAAARSRQNPQVRAISQRSQRLDLAIGDALQDLPVPTGAVERLLAALGTASAAGKEPHDVLPAVNADDSTAPGRLASEVSSMTTPPAAERTVVPRESADRQAMDDGSPAPEDSPRTSRRAGRTRNSWGAMAAAVVIVLVAVMILRPHGGEYGQDKILNDDWLFTVDENEFQQTPMEKAPPARYRFDNALAVKPTAWRPIEGLLKRPHGVAYQLRSAVAQATLYVTDAEAGLDAPRLGELPIGPPPEPPVKTGGKAMSAWQQGGLLYVLVVRGDDAEYHSFVTAGGQLARRVRSARLPATFALASGAASPWRHVPQAAAPESR